MKKCNDKMATKSDMKKMKKEVMEEDRKHDNKMYAKKSTKKK